MSDLVSEFDSLGNASQPADAMGEVFAGVPLSPSGSRHLAKDLIGRPCLLFQVDSSSSSAVPPNVSLENLSVENGLLCRIGNTLGTIDTGSYTIIRCLSTERSLQEYFLRSLGGIVGALPDPIDTGQASRIVHDLAQLFQALSRPTSRSALGLWAELFVMLTSDVPSVMMQAWHSEVCDRYDFSFGGERVEVKASGDRSRRHHFSLEQAYPPSGVTVLVASVFAEHCTNGTSLGQLWDELRAHVSADAELMLKLERTCMEILGDTWQAARKREFDWELALQSLELYDMDCIPKVNCDQPDGVSEIVFRSDLSLTEPVTTSSDTERGPLFSSVMNTCK